MPEARPVTSSPDGPSRSGGAWRRWTGPAMVSVVTWLLAAPAAFILPSQIDQSPLSAGAPMLPLTAAFCLVIAVFAAVARWSGRGWIAGVGAGLAAAWTVLMLRTALIGTPFGFGGLVGDMARTTASATRYTTTLASSDTLVPTLPSEYPPLYTWLIGRTSVLLDVPAWRLVADFEVLFISASVLAGFLLWRRLAGDWVALAITALTLVTWSDPRKAYEVLTLVIFVPWALEVFARPPRPRLHWLPAGLLGGFLAVTYQAWLVYAASGLAVIALLAWRGLTDRAQRREYVRRLLLVGLVTAVVSAWYVGPFLWATLTRGGQRVSDEYVSSSINTGLFPFLAATPLAVLQLVGLVGLVWLWRSRTAWWARPLLLLVLACYAYRLLAMIRFGFTGHSGFLHYTSRLYGVLFTVAGVLVIMHVVPVAVRRLGQAPPRLAAPAALAVVLAWSATTFTLAWMPTATSSGPANQHALAAHTEPLPDGGYPRYAPAEGRRAWLPVTPIQEAVERVLGPQPRPVTLAADGRLFSYLPWPGYLDSDRTAGSTLSRWDERYAEVRRLAGITDPGLFHAVSANTRFGPIDVFVLRAEENGWSWRDLRFRPTQFAPDRWTVVTDLPADVVVAIRR